MAPPGFPPRPRASEATLLPAKLTDFRLAGPLGSGTTARVYAAVDTRTGGSVAIKILEPSLEPSQSGEMRERFAREAILLAGVTSRHVGSILGFGFERGQPFLVLERLDGETLDAKLRRDGPAALPAAVKWVEQLLVGVRDCHDKQIIHRDIKPANIFLHREGGEQIVKLIDFGVARLREIAGEEPGLTSSNHLIGSMGYMAPEQFRNAKSVGFTSDLYAVGVCIFRTLTGRLPFVSRSVDAVIRMKSEQVAPLVSSMPSMPKNALLDWFVQRTLARDPADRFQNAREMLERWWTVMASLDPDSPTEVTGEGALRPSLRPEAPPDHEEDRTLRRASPVLGVAANATAPAMLASTAGGPDGSGAGAADLPLMEPAPPTEPAPGVLGGRAPSLADVRLDDDDMPTRSDPNLRKIVERELELHRKRTEGSR
jgi:serine/threonine-protein kinase